jgi:hypothetical protein
MDGFWTHTTHEKEETIVNSPLEEKYKRPCLGVCPKCKMHGAIVFNDGSQSAPIICTDKGIELVRLLVNEGKLSREDGDRIEDQINSSDFLTMSRFARLFGPEPELVIELAVIAFDNVGNPEKN